MFLVVSRRCTVSFWMSFLLLSATIVVMHYQPHSAVRASDIATATTRDSPYDAPRYRHRAFRTSGPIVTITIPHDLTSWNDPYNYDDDDDVKDDDTKDDETISTSASVLLPPQKRSHRSYLPKFMIRTKQQFQSILDTTLLLLQPNCMYKIQTKPGQLPLPYWLPSLKSCTARFGFVTTNTNANCRANRNVRGSNRHTPTTATTATNSIWKDDPVAFSRSHFRCFVEGMTKFEWDPRFFVSFLRRRPTNNNVLQIAIQPYHEWITTLSNGKTASSKKLSSASASSSSVLLHVKNGSTSYAWLRLMSSSLPSLSSVPLTSFDHISSASKVTEAAASSSLPTSNYFMHSQKDAENQRSYEASIRASTLIPVPLASVSSIRITPTLRWIPQRQPRIWSPPPITTSSTAPPTNAIRPTHVRHLYDTSCELELTSGGRGHTTATLTVTPCSNLATSIRATKQSILSLAMEYRLSGSGGFHLLRRRAPWNRKSGNPRQPASTSSRSLC